MILTLRRSSSLLSTLNMQHWTTTMTTPNTSHPFWTLHQKYKVARKTERKKEKKSTISQSVSQSTNDTTRRDETSVRNWWYLFSSRPGLIINYYYKCFLCVEREQSHRTAPHCAASSVFNRSLRTFFCAFFLFVYTKHSATHTNLSLLFSSLLSFSFSSLSSSLIHSVL